MGTRVYVGRLPYDVRERDLEKFFKGYGRVKEILLKNGFGFVDFDDYRDADDAVYELNGKELLGERILVQHAHGEGPRGGGGRSGGGGGGGGGGRWGGGGGRNSSRNRGGNNNNNRYGPPTRTDYRVIVENLSSRVSWQDLKDYMRQAGEVTYADAHKQHRNEGVVEFSSHSDMRAALDKLNGSDLNGRKIKLYEDKSSGRRGRRSRSRSRSRSKRRSGSRSRSRSGYRSKSRSRSRSRSKSRSPKHSRKDKKSRSGSRDRSRSKSRGSRSKSRSKSHSKSRSKSRGKSRSKSRDKSRSPSKSKDRSRSRSRSASKGPETNGDRSSGREQDDKMDNE